MNQDRITLGEMKEIILDQADMTGSSFIDDKKLQYGINAETRELYDLLVASFSDYFIKRFQVTWGAEVAAGSTSVQLPEDFFKAICPLYEPSGSNVDIYVATRISLREIPRYTNSVYNTQYSVRYYISGDRMHFLPTPASGDSLDLWYVPTIPWFRKDSDVMHFGVPVGWEDFVISGCVARCLAKEESDVSFWLQRKASLRQHIIEMADERDEGQPRRVIDAYNRFSEYEDEEEW